MAFSAGVRMIWRDNTTDIVPVGAERKSSTVRPNRLWTSSTAVDRSGPICAGLFTPSADTEWQTKQPVFTNQAPGPVFIASSAVFSSTVCGSVRGVPGTIAAGTGDLRHDRISMASACASFVVRWKFGITMWAQSGLGAFKRGTYQADEVFLTGQR